MNKRLTPARGRGDKVSREYSLSLYGLSAFTGYIQLFQQRLSPKSVKAYATMPIGIMSSNFLDLLD